MMTTIKISVCVPTFKKDISKQLEDIKRHISPDTEIVVSSEDVSAAVNRNRCLDKAKGDIIIMVDDDITGFFPDWHKILIKPLEENSISIVSARLINKDGANAPLMYDGTKYNIVPTTCIAFRKTGIRFDENYQGSGFEDTDFCKQMELVYPQKRKFINENCRLVHLNEKKRQDFMSKNRNYFVSKWGLVHHPKEPTATIVYYTANQEKESFESKVIDNILKVKGTLPIVSVSQKPLDFGINICVGELKQNYRNAFWQALVGCLAAKTDYVVMCEDDCLYPSDYFKFKPTKLDVIYTYDNVWLMWNRHNRTRFYKHGTTAGSIILGRDFYINLLQKGHNFHDPKIKWQTFTGEPLINIKTRQGISFGTTLTKGVKPQKSFPLWGTVEDVKRNYGL